MSFGEFVGQGIGALGNYYLGTSGAEDARRAGQAVLTGTEMLGQQALAGTQFQPYTVTSSLANVSTNPQGGFNLQLSPQQLAQQQALFGQAQGMFGQVGQGMTRAERDAQNRRFREAEAMFGRARGDTGALAGEYYENIRAAQRPEEERQRMNLDQGLFSSGRGGISTAEFGGTAEEFAFEKARAEAGLQASALAREAALGEQAQALESAQALSGQAYLGEQASQLRDTQALALGTGLFGQAYVPQQQALDLFGAAQIPAQLVSRGQLAGQEFASQAGLAGLQGLLSGEELANYLERASIQAVMPMITGGAAAGTNALVSLGTSAWDSFQNWYNSGGTGTPPPPPPSTVQGIGGSTGVDSDGDGWIDTQDMFPNDPSRH